MEIICTRSSCHRPQNSFGDLDDNSILKTVQQKYCTACGMPLILVGRYLPIKLLGRGGFGAAFLARDRYTPKIRLCVVKQFQPAGNLTTQQLQIAQNLFEREGEVLEQLGTHPQIPDLYAFFEITVPNIEASKQTKFFYLVQEFIDGHNLEEELAQKGNFSQTEVITLLREILPVLKFVHENGSIHRDIKPSNIMRDRRGVIYLLDFGAVKKAAVGTTTSKSTGIYTMGFAPPEQMAGGQVYPSTDLYALAVTCIQLLTGKQPTELFDAYNNQWNWRNYVQVDAHFAEVLDRMLLAAPNQRFQSAQEVIDVINLVTTPSSIQPPSPVVQTPKPSTPQPSVTSPTIASTSATSNIQSPSPAKFSIWQLLGGAAFTGFEGSLLLIALLKWFPSPAISFGIWGMIMGGLIFAQFRRIIEKVDLLIIAAITMGVVWFLLRSLVAINLLLLIPILAAAAVVAITVIFRLIYQLLAKIL
ncbi:serine/threonine protein kinase [Crinalium epipsammum PCC 9333]|uniref:non-specific serine/threonine protein kinase n=1 Tax=Crinalium epipsammum PCC 9333 TaxID=1173022 RepID=K9VZP0_9CYAN|nr:serine/threonine-protein kinase [Crinalium epipsammum]AFZ12972.1 serine/threonine protein kinase [Crinalium epipsammum PCC 9333]